jgi:hypothetical protein
VSDLNASFSKRLRCQGAKIVGSNNFYSGKACNKNIYDGLSLQENKHKQELPNISNAHERTNFLKLNFGLGSVECSRDSRDVCFSNIANAKVTSSLHLCALRKHWS